MGRIGVLLSFVRQQLSNEARVSDVKVNIGGSIVTARHVSPAGDDAYPLPGDYVFVGRHAKTGGYVATGYADTENEPQAQAGEKRVYARNESGDVVCQVWLQNDGSVLVSNDNGNLTLLADGNVECSGTLNVGGDINSGGNISADGDVSDGIGSMQEIRNTYNSHTHTGNQGNPTSPPAQQM